MFDCEDEDANLILIDFGTAKIVEDEVIYSDLCGTIYYLSPEIASKSKKYPMSGKILKGGDIWSIGVITYVLLTGRPPFKGKNNREILISIVKKKLKFPDDIELSDSFINFVKKCLTKHPNKRIKLNDAIKHPWIIGQTSTNQQLNQQAIKLLKQFNYQR